MQPPPRKGSSVKFLKTLHAEQIAKLQVKNQTECELLEDLRSFIIKKSALEKSYSEALLKIVSVYLNKKITTSIPDFKTEGSDERWNMWSVWRTVLEENEKLCKSRLTAVEIFLQQIADDSKMLRLQKLQTTKKCVDLLALIQKEVQATVQDVEKTKKVYFDEEHCAHDVRDKAKDIEAKLKRKKGSFFQSFSTLQKSSAKVSLKREQMDDKSVGARNDYLLSLVAANAHQTRYFVNDLQTIMQTMESNVYEKVQEYLTLIGRAELITCVAKQASYTKIKDQAQKLTREYNLQCLYLYYPVLKQHIQYDFEACQNDNIDYITLGSANTASQFMDEVKDWLEILIREKRAIKNNHQKLRSLVALRESGERFDPDDPNGPDIDTKIDELQEAIRRSEVIKVKTESKVELLKRSSDENVKEIYKKLDEELGNALAEAEEELKAETSRPSISSVQNREAEEKNYSSDEESVSYKAPTKKASIDEERIEANSYTQYTAAARSEDVFKQFEDSWSTNDDQPPSSTQPDSSSISIYKPPDDTVQNTSYEEFENPFRCVVLYNYTAQNPDELTIVANEELEILGEGDGDGWLRARNTAGQEGFVPCTYLDSFTGAEEETIDQEEAIVAGTASHLTSQISFSSVDYTVNADNFGKGTTNEYTVISGGGDVCSDSSASVVTTVQEIDYDKTNENNVVDDDQSAYCIALYDYETTEPSELPLREGQVIRILRKIVHDGIDDGWWEGEVDGQVGLFPSLMVQDCTSDGRPIEDDFDAEPPMSAPPVFTPPEIPAHILKELGDDCDGSFAFHQTIDQSDEALERFSFGMSDNQHKQYNAQFVEEEDEEDTLATSVTVTSPPETAVPDISISIICADGDGEEPNANNDGDENDDDFNLGVTQIVITAPTPSSDAVEKSFPPDPAPDDSQISVAATMLERRKSAGEINEAEPPLYDASLNECLEYPTTIIEEPEEEEEEEEKYAEEYKKQERKSSGGNTVDSTPRHSLGNTSFGDTGDDPASSSASSSSTYPNCVPEQLDTHQLQRLQKLKESKA